MLDKIQQFKSDDAGYRTRFKVNDETETGQIFPERLYNLFSAAGEGTKVEQTRPNSPTGRKRCMVSLQQAETARRALIRIDGLGMNVQKFSTRPKTSVLKDVNNPSFNSHPTGFRDQVHRKEGNFCVSGTRLGIRYDGSGEFNPHRQVATAPAQDKSRDSFKPESSTTISRKHCNLYVLNLSLDMTNESLKAIMQEIGEVKHVCVLATLDNAGRRRAFVDMSTPEEAHQVVQTFHGKKIEGYELHISYAFIQRSGGPTIPFDGNMTIKSTEKRRTTLTNQYSSGPKSSAHRNSEDRDKVYFTKKLMNFSASQSNKPPGISSRMNLVDLASQVNPSSQNVPPLESPGRTPDSDKESGFPATPLSSYDVGGNLQNGYTSFLPEMSFEETMNSYNFFSPSRFNSKWTLWVSNLSPVACIDSDDLFRFLIRQGITNLKSASLNVDSQSGISLGYGTLVFDSIEDYHKAFETINSKDITLGGSKINCAKSDSFHSGAF